jgi:hypothetical protein
MSTTQELLQPILQKDGASFASYSSKIYFLRHQTSRRPEFTADLNQIEDAAKAKLTAETYDYASGGAGLGTTMQANRDAFKRVGRLLQTGVYHEGGY